MMQPDRDRPEGPIEAPSLFPSSGPPGLGPDVGGLHLFRTQIFLFSSLPLLYAWTISGAETQPYICTVYLKAEKPRCTDSGYACHAKATFNLMPFSKNNLVFQHQENAPACRKSAIPTHAEASNSDGIDTGQHEPNIGLVWPSLSLVKPGLD